MKKLGVIAAIVATIVVLGFIIVPPIVNFHNTEVTLVNSFKQKTDERIAFYDKMFKVLTEKTEVAVKNDESFRENVKNIMASREDGDQVFFKWIKEVNPNANYEEVSALYKDLSRSIEGQREGFFEQEKMLQDIVKQHDNLLSVFPTNIINSWFFNRENINYTPIQATRTSEVMTTGVDNNIGFGLNKSDTVK